MREASRPDVHAWALVSPKLALARAALACSTRRSIASSTGARHVSRIARIKGFGPKTATAIVAAIGDGSEFKNGRHLAAWVGLVPRQFSSGDRKVLMGISKRGNQHLRSLLVHGARAVVRTAPRKTDLNKVLPHFDSANRLTEHFSDAGCRQRYCLPADCGAHS
jgi:transposase